VLDEIHRRFAAHAAALADNRAQQAAGVQARAVDRRKACGLKVKSPTRPKVS
jgi:hypothetical protein